MGMAQTYGMSALDMEGEWANRHTRTPRRKQRGRPSHIDTVTATRAARQQYRVEMDQIGSGTGLDEDGTGDTDHKLMVFKARVRGDAVPPPQRWVWRASATCRHPERREAYTRGIQADPDVRAVGEGGYPSTPEGLTAAHRDLVRGLERQAQCHIGKKLLRKPTARRRFHTPVVRGAHRASVEAWEKAKRVQQDPGASQEDKDQAWAARTRARKALRLAIRQQCHADAVAYVQAVGAGRNQEKRAHALRQRITRQGNGTTAPGDVATMDFEGLQRRAQGEEEVSVLISEYTAMVSRDDRANGEFDQQFRGEITEALRGIRETEPYKHHDGLELNSPIGWGEVEVAVKSLADKLYKSPGPDGATYWMLVWGGEALVTALHKLYSEVWDTGCMPAQWEEALITYIYKGKGKKTEVSNYRPISLSSVVAKVFTRVLLPRLAKVLEPTLALVQGCGKKGSGAMEHLWSFHAVVREAIQEKPVYTLFADVHKAYDQVWREGLYFALYAAGVRGRAWYCVQRWLDTATATPKWNGTVGHTVPLEQGLRQGCVLSPLLYCAFINMLVMRRLESAVAATPLQHAFLDEFFSSGLQPFTRTTQGGAGVQSAFLDGPTPCTLYMDDTTLMATTKSGLESLIAAYVRFCSKFRMRINHDKSKVLTFGSRQPQQRGACVSGVQYPAAEGGHKFLGFVADPAATGALHVKAAVRKAKAQLAVSDAVSRRLGARLTTKYIATHVAPSVLYAAEFATAPSVATQLDREHAKFAAASMGLQPPGQWWRHESPLRLGSMLWHQPHVSWSVQVQLDAARTAARLAHAERSADSLQ